MYDLEISGRIQGDLRSHDHDQYPVESDRQSYDGKMRMGLFG